MDTNRNGTLRWTAGTGPMANTWYTFHEHGVAGHWLPQPVHKGQWRHDTAQVISDSCLDTYDRRLLAKGFTLFFSTGHGRSSLLLRAVNGDLLASLNAASLPAFVADLPAGELHRLLLPVAGIRALLPVVTVESRQRCLALVNDDGKTLVRLRLLTGRQGTDSQGGCHPLPPLLLVEPIRGYAAALRQVTECLDGDGALAPLSPDYFRGELTALGYQPVESILKPLLCLQPAEPVRRALAQVLLNLLGIMHATLDGIRGDLDSEFLHDFRVAVRRTRSLLGQFKEWYPVGELDQFRREFARLGAVTGPTRDLDVYLLRFDDYCRMLPHVPRKDLEPFCSFLGRERNRERAALLRELGSSRFARFCSRWQTFLEGDRDDGGSRATVAVSIREAADRRVWKLFHRCLAEGRAIDSESPAEALHELRKTCKKMRYLLEFCQGFHPPGTVAVLIKALKALQENLGDIQDLQVQASGLGASGVSMAEGRLAPPATLLAMGMLAERLLLRQHQSREEFQRRFEAFCSDEHQTLFCHLFGPTGRKE